MNPNLEEVYIFQLEKTLRAIKHYKKQVMKGTGLTITSDQWVLVKRISEVPGVNQKELATSTFKDPASVKRTLDLLEKMELVERTVLSSDRREHSLHLTPNGQDLVHKMLPIAIDVRAKGTKGISQEEMDMLTTTLQKIQQNLS